MSHKLVFNQTPEEFSSETYESKALLEDIIGAPVIGYRASTYSITRRSLWALDILHEAGFLYDSSIFPIQHDVYGIPDASPVPSRIATPKGAPCSAPVPDPLARREGGSSPIQETGPDGMKSCMTLVAGCDIRIRNVAGANP